MIKTIARLALVACAAFGAWLCLQAVPGMKTTLFHAGSAPISIGFTLACVVLVTAWCATDKW